MLYVRNYLEFMEVRGEIEDRIQNPEFRSQKGKDKKAKDDRGEDTEMRRRGERRSPDALSIEFRNVSFAYPSAMRNGDMEKRPNIGIPDRRGAACSARPANANDTKEKTNPFAGRDGKTINFSASGGGAGAACCAPTETNTPLHSVAKSDYILKNVSFHIDRGQTLAIVGENGAGKSTIVKLLARLYDPDDGSVLLGGRDMRVLSPE